MTLQMAYFEREHSPVIMEFGPVLDLEDTRCARWPPGPMSVIRPTLRPLDPYSVDELIGFARRLDPGLTDQDFATQAAA